MNTEHSETDYKKLPRKHSVPNFIPVSEYIYNPQFIHIFNKFSEFLHPKNKFILNKAQLPYTLEDIEYSYNNFVLPLQFNENSTDDILYKKRVLSSILFTCFCDIILDFISTLTFNMNMRNFLTIIIGGMATRYYNIQHYTNDIDIKIYPINKEVNDTLLQNKKQLQILEYFITSIAINFFSDNIYLTNRFTRALLLLNLIPSLKNNKTISQIYSIHTQNVLKKIPLMLELSKTKTLQGSPIFKIIVNHSIFFDTTHYKNTASAICDISFFDSKDEKHNSLLREIQYHSETSIFSKQTQQTQPSLIYNIPYVKISQPTYYGNNIFFIQDYNHILIEKHILFNDLKTGRNLYNQTYALYLLNKFKKSIDNLTTTPIKRTFIGGYNKKHNKKTRKKIIL